MKRFFAILWGELARQACCNIMRVGQCHNIFPTADSCPGPTWANLSSEWIEIFGVEEVLEPRSCRHVASICMRIAIGRHSHRVTFITPIIIFINVLFVITFSKHCISLDQIFLCTCKIMSRLWEGGVVWGMVGGLAGSHTHPPYASNAGMPSHTNSRTPLGFLRIVEY